MKIRPAYILVLASIIGGCHAGATPAAEPLRPRLIILADMGNEPDEVQQMLHLLMYANEVELEGLIAVTGKYLRPDHHLPYRRRLHPELFENLIDGYETVYPNLQLHADHWPTPYHLRSIVSTGQPGYGIKATGSGLSSPGSKLIIDAASSKEPRPLHIVVNAGSNTLAQALQDFRAAHSPAETAEFVRRLRVFENGAQDNSGAWICHEFPDIFWVRSNYQTYCYGGPTNDNLGPHTWSPFAYDPAGQDAWANEHVRTAHGALGEMYPPRAMGKRIHFIEGGGTIPWLGLVKRGLTDFEHPSWGGWSGRFSREKLVNVWSRHADIKADEAAFTPFSVYTESADEWTNPTDGKTYHDDFTPIWRWRQAMWSDFQARMDWCVQPHAAANHHPVAVLNGDASDAILRVTARVGQTLTFDAAASSDPDGDAVSYSWWHYVEAGPSPYPRLLELPSTTPQTKLTVPADAAGTEIHLILEVTDDDEVPLTDYRRVVIAIDA